MSAIYIINHTDPATPAFTINPNSVNGPGNAITTTNLQLYGAGSLRFGEGQNENFLHLLENFASPEATGGSPLVGLGIPDDNYFLSANAVKGQLWFNSSTSKMMVYDGSAWISAGGTTSGAVAPPSPQDGDLWYDTGENQLKVYYSSSWTSTADRYVLKAGDTMTGTLVLSGDPGNPLEAATKQYVDSAITSSNEISELTDVTITTPSTKNVLYYDGAEWVNQALVSTDITDVTSSIQTQLDNKLALAGGTLTGALTLSGAPTASLHSATKSYVDGHAFIFTSTGADPGGSPKNGDIWVDTVAPKVYIRAASTWRQVWPAQYS